MPSNFEQLVFEIIATDRNASAAFDRFRQKVDQTSSSVDSNTSKMDKNAKSIEALGSSAEGAAGGLGGLAGIGGGGIAAVAAAAVALSPALVTVGAGLGGLALAAYGAGKNSKLMRQELGPLKADVAAFQKQLQPTVLQDFGLAAAAARPLLAGLEPVTRATGKALGGLFGELGAEFRSKEFTQFFTWMGQQAGPDVRLLGTDVINLTKALPPLLEGLQPIANALLTDTNAVTGLAVKIEDLAAGANKLSTIHQGTAHSTNILAQAFHNAVDEIAPEAKWAGVLIGKLAKTGEESRAAAGQQRALSGAGGAVNQVITDQAKQLNILAAGYIKALTPLENYIGGTIAERNDLVTLNQDLKKSHDAIGLKTAAERASFGDTQTFINQTIQTGNAALAAHKGIQGQIDVIKAALPALENVRGKTSAYRQELGLLKGILDKLRAEKLIREQVSVTGSGRWAFMQSGVGHAVGPGGAAGGAFIRQGTTGTADDVLARVSRGELIVPARMVSLGLVDHLRGIIPGFAAGGIIPSYSGSPGGLPGWTSHNQQATITGIAVSIAQAMASALRSVVGAGVAGPGGGAPAANAALARRMMPAWGSGAEWAAWNAVAMRESGWSQFARNPSSGAYGIPQALPPGKMGAAANPPMSNPAAQISWMIGYIRSRYGDPIGAWQHELSAGWYDRGGYLPTGLSLALNTTGKPEPVGGGATVNYNISVYGTAHPAEAGRVIVEKIKEYEKRSGASWRR